ncbi:MAG: ABC transporter permease [Alphaproteobacteria bacterium]|nr:ABC transporter permease [Alphaproteobacteria bacterium]
MRPLPLALRLAARELRGGLSGFRIFLACLALGVAAIAAVGSMRSAFIAGIAEEGRTLLGGDVEVEITHRPADGDEAAWLRAQGEVSEILMMRAIARRADGAKTSLVELKAVDGAYPLYGAVATRAGIGLAEALADRDGRPGVLVEEALARRLGIAVGDPLVLGTLTLELRGLLVSEPDSLAGGFALGPRLLVSGEALMRTGLVQRGSLIEYRYRVRLAPETTNAEVGQWVEALKARFPDAEWQVRDRRKAGRSLSGIIDQVTVFLTFVGLTALVVGGVGVGNAVTGYLDGRRETIATLKTLGAPSGLVFRIYLAQILALGAVGIALGLLVGAALPLAVLAAFADILPIPSRLGLYPLPLALAGVYGLLTAFAFTVLPLARARDVPAAGLFRDLVAPARAMPARKYLLAAGAAFAALAGLSVLFAEDRSFAAWFVLGAAAVFAALRLAGEGLKRLARTASQGRRADLRIALANLHRPGAPTGAVVLSLGLGLTLLVTVALIDGNIAARVRNQLPAGAPSFFIVDIQADQLAPFLDLARTTPGISEIAAVPNLRGRVTRLDGVPALEATIEPEGRWALRGDRGVTFAAELPEGTSVVAGEWWPPDYSGPPLVSLEDELARRLHLGLGDTVTLNVLGREITFTVANLRRLDWERLGINFLFIAAPGTLEAARPTYLATLVSTMEAEEPFQKALIEHFPNITAVRVREALASVNEVLQEASLAVRATSAVTLLAGVLVLAGALAAGRRRRLYDAVLLKVLGAPRGRILKMLALEYLVLGIATAALAALAGGLAAYFVVTGAMETSFVFLPWTLAATLAGASLATVLIGLFGTAHSLSGTPARILRHA